MMISLLKHFRLQNMIVLSALAFGATLSWAQLKPPPAGTDSANPAKPNLSSADLTPKVVEDYNTPALTAGTKLSALTPLDLELDDDDPVFTRQITRVQWRAADPIDLYIIKPVGVKKPPLVVYLYDYPTETERFQNREFCRLLVKNGFAAVGFVGALTGQRYHDRPMKEWFVSEMPEALASSAHDVQMLLNYMTERGDVDVSRVGIYGEGSGATIAILAAAVDPRIQTLDLTNPWGDWPDWVEHSTRIPEKERSSFVNPEYLAKVAPLDPVKWLPQLKTQKIRLQNVRSVGETPVETQKKIEAAAPANVQLLPYDDMRAYVSAVPGDQRFNWVKEQMQGGGGKEYRANGNGVTHDSAGRTADSSR
jgi:hypothetical protein